MEIKITVASKSQAVMAMETAFSMSRALLDGTSCMRLQGEKYLPKWPNEEQKSYDKRKETATLFPAYKRTVETLAARPFSKPITLEEDVPETIKEHLKNADMQGRNLDQLGYDLMCMALGPGFGGVLVEHSVRPAGVVTKADEVKAGLRPYIVVIQPESILGWRSEIKDGESVLTMLRIMEVVEENEGEWMTRNVDQVRVLTPGKWETYRKNAEGDWLPFADGASSLDYIPFYPIYGDRTAFMQAKPPLMELAYLNVKHWQSQSDQDTLMHVARVPILTLTGITDSDPDKPFEITIGASAAVRLPQDATMAYVEHTGSAIEAGKVSLDDLKEEMRQSGAELLVIKPGPTTATEVASDNAVGMCALQRIALMLQDVLNHCLQTMADYKKEQKGGTLKLFMDFAAATLAEASASMLIGLANGGGLSRETLINELKRRGIVSSDVTWESEKELIDAEGPSLLTEPPAPGGGPALKPPGPPKPPAAPAPKPPAVK